jgi:hypothetical protein
MGDYPLAGEDASYSGLRSFSCNYGDCDPDACGTTEVDLIIPTVSEFAPPACTSGTGEGNLAGLCSYSCGYGFCPINACTCTGTGGGLVLPPVANDVSGYADPSVDAETYGPFANLPAATGTVLLAPVLPIRMGAAMVPLLVPLASTHWLALLFLLQQPSHSQPFAQMVS